MKGFLISLAALGIAVASVQAYDPLAPRPGEISNVDLAVQDSARNREIPVRVYLPAAREAAPVVLYSHGLGGSRETAAFLGEAWARRGYVAVFIQHHGSDEGVWKGVAEGERMAALKAAVSLTSFIDRVEDVPAVLDRLAAWNGESAGSLAGRMNLEAVGMSGHSFGGVTTQAVSGENFPQTGQRFSDARIKAALVMSPSVRKRSDPAVAFGKVKIPWLLMTGTKDDSPLGDQPAASRLEVFPALPAGDKYELVLENAEHSVFTDRALPGDHEPRNPHHHQAILALSTAFWDAYLRGDAAAKAWLEKEARSVLEPKDQWLIR